VSLPAAIEDRVGQSATIRVGLVVGVSPLRVEVQGTVFNELGLCGTMPSVGDRVLLLGQAVAGGASSGSSWVCMGRIVST
jgi:hypothetical protein